MHEEIRGKIQSNSSLCMCVCFPAGGELVRPAAQCAVEEQVEMEDTTETVTGVFGLNHVIPVSTA